jgi:hypothetical protein
MPASPALALRGRVRRLGAGVFACALALAFPPAASAADREFTISVAAPAAWEGRAATGSALPDFEPATLIPCETVVAVCDSTVLHVTGSGTLSVELAPVDATTGDVDLYVHRPDALGVVGPPIAVSAADGPAERVDVPAATGSYLVRAVSFGIGKTGIAARASLTARPASIPDIDHPRGRQEELVSDPRDGAASQPAVAISPRERDLVVAAYRVFAGDDYVSQIATAVSFDRGRHWEALGAVSGASAANPAVGFDADGDALLLTNDLPGSVLLRRWTRPEKRDLRRDRVWEAPSVLSDGAIDERPVLARARDAVLACWVRTTDLGAYGRQAVRCRHSHDGGLTWGAETQPSPATVANVPYGPYVGGVAVTGRRGGFDVAWVDTSHPGGADTAWVAHTTGTSWDAPVRAARFRSLPERFAGEAFRNVTLLSLAAARGRLYLAYASRDGVQVVHSDTWEEPVTVADGAFQPSIAAARDDVHVLFLDRGLAAPFLDEWLASSDDRGGTWDVRRLSHDSWDPAIGAPRSPTGDLLGDRQALAADRCGAVALAADPHLANAWWRDREFDRGARTAARPQLFAWADRRCE